MESGTERALERLEKANRIYEPGQSTWRVQLVELIIWTLECGLIWLLVRRWIE